MRTYAVTNPAPEIIGLMESGYFGVLSWPISTFGGLVPPLSDPIVVAAIVEHETNIINNRLLLGIADDGGPVIIRSYPTSPLIP